MNEVYWIYKDQASRDVGLFSWFSWYCFKQAKDRGKGRQKQPVGHSYLPRAYYESGDVWSVRNKAMYKTAGKHSAILRVYTFSEGGRQTIPKTNM